MSETNEFTSNQQPFDETPSSHYEDSYNDYKKIQALQEKVEKAEKNSITDSLTGLHNRRYLDDYIENFDKTRIKQPTTVIFCDIDNLGAINKEKGDSFGDELIKKTANTLLDVFRDEDKVIRKGGDELVILCENFGEFEEFNKEISDRLKSKQSPDLQFSFGIVQYDSSQDKSFSDTIQRSNDLMRENNPNKKIPKH
jgi:diguanylate cyclase (GGDEF)-like protein